MTADWARMTADYAGDETAGYPRRGLHSSALPRTRADEVLQAVTHDDAVQAMAFDGEDFGGAGLVSIGGFKGALHQLPLGNVHRHQGVVFFRWRIRGCDAANLFGKIRHAQLLASGKHDRVLDGVNHLAHSAGPIITAQQYQSGGRERPQG